MRGGGLKSLLSIRIKHFLNRSFHQTSNCDQVKDFRNLGTGLWLVEGMNYTLAYGTPLALPTQAKQELFTQKFSVYSVSEA